MFSVKNISGFLLLLTCSLATKAQEMLTIDDAIRTGLKNNYSISISRNDVQIAKNNVTLGNAGALPQVAVVAGQNFASANTHQNYSSGQEINKNNVTSNGTSAGVQMTWTIFQGFRMYATLNKLKEFEKLGEDNLKTTVENTVQQIVNTYYDIVQQKQLIKAINGNIGIYEDKLKIAQEKFNIGSSSKLDYLQARVDLNAQRSRLLQSRINLNNDKANLNQLMARAPETDFDVADTIIINFKPNYEELKRMAMEQNTQIAAAEANSRIAYYTIKEFEALRYPSVTLNPAYNYTRSENQAGFILLNQNLGWNVGVSAYWNIFNGFNLNRTIRNSKISYESSNLNIENNKLIVQAGVNKAFQTYQNYLQMLALEEENYTVAQENVKVALERYRLGSSSEIELKQAQQSLEDAQIRLFSARYQAKVNETDMMRLSGQFAKML